MRSDGRHLYDKASRKEERAMNVISVFAMPVFIAVFIVYGLIKKVGVYDCFSEGAKEGVQSMLGIVAPLVGLMVAINMFRERSA